MPADMLTNLRQMAGTLTSASLAPTSRLPHAPITSIVDPEVAGRPDSLAELTSVIASGACVAQAGSEQQSGGDAPDIQSQSGQPDSPMPTLPLSGEAAELCCALVRVWQRHTEAHLRSCKPASWRGSCLTASGIWKMPFVC